VIVEGEEGYKAARGFMKLLMPSHVRRVKLHSEATPSFQRYGVEDQLSAMYQPIVQLKSGGYLVINPTEALVSIDINSGRSTREHNIEQTAYNTNLEAAQEIARQLRLRDMAGLIVIDFIDMEQNGHVRKVEKAMKEALKNDRARIQVGRISTFGLMEMSRQRLRTGVLEASTKTCPHCEGTGLMRTAASAGLSALRMLEDEAARGRGERILLRCGKEAAVYLLNKKRAELADVEQRYGVMIEVIIDESLEGARMTVDSSGPRPIAAPRPQVAVEEQEDADEEEIEAEYEEDREDEVKEDQAAPEREHQGRRRRRRGGRGRGRREGGEGVEGQAVEAGEAIALEAAEEPVSERGDAIREAPAEEPREGSRRRRRRRGRGGQTQPQEARVEPDSSPMVERPIDEEPPIAEIEAVEEPQPEPAPAKGGRRKKAPAAEAEPAVAEPAPAEAPPAEKPARKRRGKKADAAEAEAPPAAEPVPVPAANNDIAEDADGEPRRGWWQRTFG
jgi:ribonuclease E